MHLGKDSWASWNDFCFEVFADYIPFSFYVKYIWEKCYKNFLGRSFYGCSYRSNGTKIHLDTAMHHNYIANIIPTSNSYHRRKNALIILQDRVNHNFFKNSFFLSTIKEGNVYDYDINNSDSFVFLHQNFWNSFDYVQIVYLIVIIQNRQGIWLDHLLFCLMFTLSVECDSAWSKVC